MSLNQTKTDKQMSRSTFLKTVEGLSPFELKDELLNVAKNSGRSVLDAGRGNPNWIASTARQAFFALGQFAVHESKWVWCEEDLAGMPQKEGIYQRYQAYSNECHQMPGIELLNQIIDYGVSQHHFNADEWLYELVDGIIGDYYPVPDRMLIHTEQVVKDYLIHEMGGDLSQATHELFAVEGGTAAMCYLFESLKVNGLLKPKDKIALFVPIFTPYLEIAELPGHEFDIIPIQASSVTKEGVPTWQYPKAELDKLKDPAIKLACIVNPSNPASVALDPQVMDYLKEIVTIHHPKLMLITDDVYGTFCEGFTSLMVTLPYHTIGVYSYSKYFGATGWRLGVIALAKENVYDDLIQALSEEEKQVLHHRYRALTTTPESIRFIDRLVADSRQVALNHTAGLSTPQQIQMAIFSIFARLDQENRYKKQTKTICQRRKQALNQVLKDYPNVTLPLSSSYYHQYDLLVWAKVRYGESFESYLQTHQSLLGFLYDLAKQGVVLLNGDGFAGPKWSVRVSLANLPDDAYPQIGRAMNEVLEQYAMDWRTHQQLSQIMRQEKEQATSMTPSSAVKQGVLG